MKIRYTLHAAQRMFERGISKRDVHRALLNGLKDDAPGALQKSSLRALKGMLVVVYNVRGFEDYEIITAYYER